MSASTRRILGTIFLLLVSVSIVFARAGGGGGGGSDDGGDISGLIWIIWYIFTLIPFPYNFIVLAIVLVVFYFYGKNKKKVSGLNHIPTLDATKTNSSDYEKFRANNPQFDENLFKSKANLAFMEIQKAWEAQDLSKVRKWISDGVYQRFNTQFAMMKMLEQKNTLKNISVKSLTIADVESDGAYDILHVCFHAQMHDEFVSAKYKNLDSGGLEEFVEFWSFIKKRGAVEKNLYHTDNCQNCGAELPPNAGELSRCEHCGTITNLGDYDWILSEITQADDYVNELKKTQKDGALAQRIRSQMPAEKDFSFQFMEDKASNGYLQICTALVKKDARLVRRFVSDDLYQKIEERIKNELPFVYNRIYLNDVTLMDSYVAEGKNNLVFAIKLSSQKVLLKNGRAEVIDPVVTSSNDVIIMSRNVGATEPKGHLYAHTCPNCGAPIQDTTDNHCSYCGAEVNSPQFEWIVTRYMPAYEYSNTRKTVAVGTVTNVDPKELDAIYDVRDYAFNNIMILIAADGKFESQEQEFAHTLAKKWGYNPDKVQAMYDMAANRKLVLRVPNDVKKTKKVYEMMKKAAAMDGSISEEEQSVLDAVKRIIDMDVQSSK